MAGNNNNRKSYFGEKRSQYMDADFFNRPSSIDDIAQNVKRIIKDIKFELISDEDLVCFMNKNIIDTLISVSYENYARANVISNSLMYYMNTALVMGIPRGYDTTGEFSLVSTEQTKWVQKSNTWNLCYRVFYNIKNGVDIKSALMDIVRVDKRYILDL